MADVSALRDVKVKLLHLLLAQGGNALINWQLRRLSDRRRWSRLGSHRMSEKKRYAEGKLARARIAGLFAPPMGRSMFAADEEQALREKREFKECASGYPTMLVVAPGTFLVDRRRATRIAVGLSAEA